VERRSTKRGQGIPAQRFKIDREVFFMHDQNIRKFKFEYKDYGKRLADREVSVKG